MEAEPSLKEDKENREKKNSKTKEQEALTRKFLT